ncbi:MAG: substrate-binding domain-containing protein [Spirochaetaceae bacterium]|jgi:ribose transport system substrate-binding protein|nr:substrate-binding domain-containing protein [Spirochaetaceae bacterium]
MKKLTFFACAAAVLVAGCAKKAEGPTPEQVSAAAEVRLPAGQVMSRGPHGETASSAADLKLSEDEIKKLIEGKYKVSIVFHYAGNDWSAAQQAGLKDQFARMGIEVLSVTDANFKAEQQISDIENAMAMKPNAIVSIPVDPVSSSSAFKKAAAAGIKLVFMDNCPDNMIAGQDYVSVVSADNYGNGVAAAEIMGDALGGEGKIAMMFHDANFFVTNQRDDAFRKTIGEKFPNIQIVEEMGFDDANKGSEIGDALLTKYPDLKGVFATWDIPAEGIVSSLRAAGRTDIAVTTIDLGDNVAKMIAENGVVKGLGAQRPYDQGVAEAILVGYALLGKTAPAYVALPSLKVTHENVLSAYEEVYHKTPPGAIKNAYK